MNDQNTEISEKSAPPSWPVDRIGARGDGVVDTPDGPVHLPFTAPGDLVSQHPPHPIVLRSPDRIDPACPHFTACGGCALQHLPPEILAVEKQRWLIEALSRRGFESSLIGPVRAVPPQTRRRARLAYIRTIKGIILGFNARGDKKVIDIGSCPVLRPELNRLIAPLRRLIADVGALGKAGDVQITHSDTGVEVMLFPRRAADPDYNDREEMVGFARDHDLARIGWGDSNGAEPIAAPRIVRVAFGSTAVEIPPASFLQPSREGEALIVAEVLRNLPTEPERLAIADLYAGCGGIGLPLAEHGHKVLAVEGNAESIAALRKASGDVPIQAEVRDLARKPLLAKELARFDVAIFDPPRAGAAKQAAALAESDVPTVIAVSCNPATLARDLGILADGGYQLQSAMPIDQFPWAAHLEAVCVMRR